MSHAQIRISKMGDALYCNVHFAFDQISFEMNVLMGCAPTQIMLVFFFFFFGLMPQNLGVCQAVKRWK